MDVVFTVVVDSVIIGLLLFLSYRSVKMSQEMDNLIAEVAATKAGEQSAIVLLDGLKKALDDLAAQVGSITPAQVQALADDLASSRTALAAAVVQDTPT